MRTPSHAARLFVLLSAALAAPPLGAEQPVSMRVTPQVTTAPATVSITVTVERHEDNLALLVEDESGEFYRSSVVGLEGDPAARTYTLVFRGLPPGRHVISATVSGLRGQRAAIRTTVTVVE